MIESLADIEVLAIRCHSEQSKDYVSEAIRCYQAGAYQAAIVSTWIAVVFDLIDKIREIAVSGDATARTGADLPGSHGYGLFVENVRKAAILDNTSLNSLLSTNRGGYLVPQVETA